MIGGPVSPALDGGGGDESRIHGIAGETSEGKGMQPAKACSGKAKARRPDPTRRLRLKFKKPSQYIVLKQKNDSVVDQFPTLFRIGPSRL